MEALRDEIRRRLAERDRLLLAIDGRCGCGKSSLGAQLAEDFGGNLFHTDDFYLPPEARAENWPELPAGNMDLARLREEILEPLRRGGAVRYRAWDCQSGSYRPAREIPFRPLSVVEGSYSQHPALRKYYDYCLFVTASPETRRARLRAREGERFAVFEALWIPLEERYFAAFQIEERADRVLRTD